MPVRNGWSCEAPEGGHSTHAGAVLDRVVVAVGEDPPEAAPEEDVVPAAPGALDWLPEPPPLDAAPATDPVPELPGAAAPEASGVAAGLAKVDGGPVAPSVP